MKNLFSILLFVLPVFIFGQNQERLSVHFYDIPQELEQMYLKFNSDINEELEKNGFGKDFYKIYKVRDNDNAKSFRYFQISSYTSDKHYKMTHEVGEKYDKIWDNMWKSELGKCFPLDDVNHIYRKVYRIEN